MLNFSDRIIPFLKIQHFEDPAERAIIEKVKNYVENYNQVPTVDEIGTEIVDDNKLEASYTDDVILSSVELLKKVKKSKSVYNIEWLMDSSEKFIKHQEMFGAMEDGFELLSKMRKGEGGINPQIIEENLKKAIGFSFDTRVGHDILIDYNERHRSYTQVDARIPFHLQSLNRITNGGLPPKTVTLVMGGVNTGKSMVLCDLSLGFLKQGKNVLYISMEMSEMEVGKRIDANMLDYSIDKLHNLSYSEYQSRMIEFKSKHPNLGNLFIKEYPMGSASVVNFRTLMNELELKRGIKTDFVVIDYMGICGSARSNSKSQSYEKLTSISQEFKGLASEKDCRIVTAGQFNKSGFSSDDPTMAETAGAFDLTQAMDLIIAINSNEALENSGQLMIKQLKSRLGSKAKDLRFNVGVDYEKMRIFDLDDPETEDEYSTKKTRLEIEDLRETMNRIKEEKSRYKEEEI